MRRATKARLVAVVLSIMWWQWFEREKRRRLAHRYPLTVPHKIDPPLNGLGPEWDGLFLRPNTIQSEMRVGYDPSSDDYYWKQG